MIPFSVAHTYLRLTTWDLKPYQVAHLKKQVILSLLGAVSCLSSSLSWGGTFDSPPSMWISVALRI